MNIHTVETTETGAAQVPVRWNLAEQIQAQRDRQAGFRLEAELRGAVP